MAIAADRLVLDLSALPWHAERFCAGFYLGRGNNRKPLLQAARRERVARPGSTARPARSTCSRPATTTCSWPNPGMLAYRASLLDLMESLTLDSRMHLR